MKRLGYLIGFLMFTSALFAGLGDWYSPGDILYVAAPSGLNLRETPDINGKLILKAEYGSELTVLKDPGKIVPFTFDNIVGAWVYVEYEGKKGYIFDGYLSSLPAPELGSGPGTVNDYLQNFLEQNGDMISSVEHGEGTTTTIEEYYYTKAVSAKISTTEYWTDDPTFIYEVYHFNGYTRIEEIFLLLRNLGYFGEASQMAFPIKSLDVKENKIGADITVTANFLKFLWKKRNIMITKEANGILLEIINN